MCKLNVQFSERQSRAIEEYARTLGKSKSGVIRIALSLLHIAVKEKRSGNSIAIVRDGLIVKELVGIWE